MGSKKSCGDRFIRFAKRTMRDVSMWSGWARRRAIRQTAGIRDGVFIWIPKTAGTSVYDVLAAHGCRIFHNKRTATYVFPQQGMVTFGHMSYPLLLEKKIVSREFHERAYKFCFVRNPFSRVVSLYEYLQHLGHVANGTDFRTFCGQLAEGAYEEIGLYNRKGLSQCNPQTAWITDCTGTLLVDFCGHVETLDQDFPHVLDVLGLDGQLPHLNKTPHATTASYYDAETIKLIAKAYEVDFDTFKYPMTGP